MNFAISLCLMVFCGLSLAQDEGNATDTRSCHDFCSLFREFGAMSEKLRFMEIRLADTETRLKETENQTLELQNKERNKVIFSAGVGAGNTTMGPFNTDTTLIYRSVIMNIGNAYSQITGVFTAPVAGVYYFSFFYHAGGNRPSALRLYKNNQVMAVTTDHKSDGDGADNGGNAVFLQLNKGDQVYVRMGANTHVWASGTSTTFSGYLVTQM